MSSARVSIAGHRAAVTLFQLLNANSDVPIVFDDLAHADEGSNNSNAHLDGSIAYAIPPKAWRHRAQ